MQNGLALAHATEELQQEFQGLVAGKYAVPQESLILHVASAEGLTSVLHFVCAPYQQHCSSSSPSLNGAAALAATGAHSSVTLDELLRSRDSGGNTPLHIAAAGGHLETVQALCDDLGAPTRARNDAGNTPLLLAEKVDIAEALIAAGADIRIGTALMPESSLAAARRKQTHCSAAFDAACPPPSRELRVSGLRTF